MEENNGAISWQKKNTSFSFSASVPMDGRERYFPEPLGTSRVVLVVTLLSNSEFRVVFNDEPTLSRGTEKAVLCFVVGQDGNSRTTIRTGNPGVILAETREQQALLPAENEKPTTYWFSYDASIRLIALGLGNQPDTESTLLVVPDWYGCFDKPNPRIFVGLANWKQAIHLNLSQGSISSLRLNKYPEKFHDDRTIKSFPGVTCICWFNEKSHGSSIISALVQAQEMLKATGPTVGGCFSFLPPDSFHMTITDLVTLNNRDTICPEIKGDLKQVGEELQKRIKDLMAMSISNVFYMKMDSLLLNHGLTIRLRPYEDKTAKAIAAWRDIMYTRLGE